MTEFMPDGNGGFKVIHNKTVVATGFTFAQASSIADDYSYYGKVVNCINDRSKPCNFNFKMCEMCPEVCK